MTALIVVALLATAALAGVGVWHLAAWAANEKPSHPWRGGGRHD